MILDLRQFDRPMGRVSGEESVRVDDPLSDQVSVPCRIDVDYRQSGGTFYFHGVVEGILSTRCHRCLDPVTTRVAGEFDLMVRRGEHEGEMGDEVVVLPPHEHAVDLGRCIRETIVLNVPMIVVCGESCRGLCPTCGANWNRETCPCRQDADPRWDALRGK
jgi:uncharacterized protein